jgi:hypothetical protein
MFLQALESPLGFLQLPPGDEEDVVLGRMKCDIAFLARALRVELNPPIFGNVNLNAVGGELFWQDWSALVEDI